jgi:membrane protein involved in colicin uptake
MESDAPSDAFPSQPPVRCTNSDGRRLSLPLLISLLAHALILSLQFGTQKFGLPGFALPWQDRRVEVPDLRVVLTPPPVIADQPDITAGPAPLPPELIEQTSPAGPLIATFKVPEPPPASPAPTIKPLSAPMAQAKPKPKAAGGTASAKVVAKLPADVPGEVVAEPTVETPAEVVADSVPPPTPFPAVIAMEQSKEPEFVVPAAPPAPVTTESTSPEDGGGAEQARKEQAARERVAEEKAARAEIVRLETERNEPARQATAKQEIIQQETARAESARLEAEGRENARQTAASQEAIRQEAARAESARIEADRQENTRQAAASKEAARQEAARAESARIEAERMESARQAAASEESARQDVARVESAQLDAKREQDAKRDAARRAMGRQLDEEAAHRKAAEEAMPRSSSANSLRRGRLFGRTDSNAELVLYADAWSRKIHLNTALGTVHEARNQSHTDPMVTVAIRSDGSVESVTFVRSSGVPAIDDAIRRIVHSQAPNLPFQPALARDFDVIEIRRTWQFDSAIRLY